MNKTSLVLLEPAFRSKVQVFLSELVRRRIFVAVLETWRSPERQAELVEQGKSQTLDSKHLHGLAIDIAPVREYVDGKVKSIIWDTRHPVWKEIAASAKELGLKWGGDWTDFRDYVHFEDGHTDG
jgi:peptidoglycan L-alanyl-D-glutamate endopeptidase CwlK